MNEIFKITPVSQIVSDSELKIVGINQSACKMLEIEEADLLGKSFSDLDLIKLDQKIYKQQSGEKILKIDRKQFTLDGKSHELFSIFNITQFNQRMAELTKENLNLNRYIDESNLIFLVLDCDGAIRTINKKGRSLLGLVEDVEGANWIERFIPEEDRKQTREVFEAVKYQKITFDDYIESVVLTTTGDKMYVGWNNTTIIVDGEVQSVLAVGFDLTDRKAKENQLISEATQDSMTKAYNRGAGLKILEGQYEYAKNKGLNLSVCFFDIDNLKEVNDTYGHFEGDRYIREIVSMIRVAVREKDSMIRYGGDEFLVVFPGADDIVTKRIIKRLETQIAKLNQRDFFRYSLSLSYGIASIKSHTGQSHLEMLTDADNRMYEMKKRMR
jgi:diguanylate cyclase (GGDEF)-like protein/PAS domain S-box-containing protein